MTIQDDFKAEIEAFLARHDMKPAAFGAQALHDPKFVFDLREGRSPSVRTIEKVRTWMAGQDREAGKAPDGTGAPEAEAPAPAAAAPTKPAGEPDSPEPAAPRKRRGMGSALAVLIILLIIAAGIVIIWKPPEVYDRAAGLYQRVTNDLNTDDRGANDRGTNGPAPGAGAPEVEQFAAVVAAVQTDFNTLRQDIRRLEGRIDELQDRMREGGGQPSATETGRLDALEERIAALEDRPVPAERPAAEDTPSPALTSRLDALADRVDSVERASATAPEELETLRNGLDRLQQTVSQLQDRQEQRGTLEEEVASLREEMNRISAGLNDMSGLQAGIERNAMISAFTRLDADIRAGRPYAASLTLYQRQRDLQAGDGDWPPAEPLAARAETGIATREALARQLEDLIPQILSGREEGDSLGERLWSRLSGIVVVRRTGEQEGSTPDAIVARAETRLAADDLAGAVRELESLPEGRRAIAEPWLADARARLDTLEALSRMATSINSGEGS